MSPLAPRAKPRGRAAPNVARAGGAARGALASAQLARFGAG
ncbi:hypothetical protein WMF26_17680 [Sorangium sp. So ce185]